MGYKLMRTTSTLRALRCALFTFASIMASLGSHSIHAQCPFNVSGVAPASLARDGLLFLRTAQNPASPQTSGTGSVNSGVTVQSAVTANRDALDLNGNSEFDSQDALLISRWLAGFRGEGLLPTGTAAVANATRTTSQDVEQFILSGCVGATLKRVNRPNHFFFIDTHEQPIGSAQTSNSVTISGLTEPAPIRVVAGSYSIGCTANFTTAAGTIANGQSVCVRHSAAAEEGASVNTTLKIADSQAMFASTTAYAFPPGLAPVSTATVTQGNYLAPPLTGSLAPTLIAVANGPWETPSTWNLSRIPANDDIVSIPKNFTVTLASTTASLNGLWVMGALDLQPATVKLITRYAFVYGRVQAGSANAPFANSAVFEFTGNNKAETILDMGTKGLVVMEGGLLKLHGQSRLSWTLATGNGSNTSTTIPVGATSLTVKDSPATWRAGDKLLIAATALDPRDSEVVTVTSISGNTVNFTPALANARYAVVQTYNGKRLDQRPSVSLLSRNIVLQGDASSATSKFGGHVMVMAKGHAQVSGVQFDRMGQLGVKGRYPIHWHIAGDRTNNYIVNSAVSGSFQRAYVVHSTNNVLVESNVAYDVINHAYVWSEDGDEIANRFIRNVGILVRSPDEANFIFPINNPFFGNSSQAEQRSGVFWGRSFNQHVLRGNISGGVLDGFSYFMDLFTPRAFDQDEGSGLVFENNVAHSNYKSLATGNQINYPEASTGHALMITTGTNAINNHVFRNYTGFYNTSSAWVEDRNTTLQNSIVADSGIGVIMLRGVVDGVTIVGKSATPVDIPAFSASISFGIQSQLHIAGSNHGGKRAPVIRDATIINHTSGAGVLWDVDNISPQAQLGNVHFDNVAQPFAILDPFRFEYPFGPNWGWNDPSGRMANDAVPARILARDSNLVRGGCKEFKNFNAYSCPAAQSLLIDADESFSVVDSNGKIAYLTDLNYDYFDDSMPTAGALSWLNHNEHYEVLTSTTRSSFAFKLVDTAGKLIEFSFAANSAPTAATHTGQPIASVASLAAMRSSTSSARFFDTASSRLYVRIVVPESSTAAQTLSLAGSFRAQPTPTAGLSPVSLPANAVIGFTASRYANAARYGLRYPIPTSAASSVVSSSASQVDANASDSLLVSTPFGTVTVFRAYVNAPVDGLYRLALWGDGGGTSVYVNGRYVMGQPWANYNSNFFTNNVPNTEVVPYLHPSDQVALKAGWHEVALVHSKFNDVDSQVRTETSMMFRWATPQNPNLWVYPQLRRAP
jgi:G8 domain